MRHFAFHTLVIFFVLWMFGCERNEPGGAVIVNPPPGTTTLVPIAVIPLAPTIPEPSGIFYYARNNSLLIVSDSRPEIFETDLDGNIMRKIITAGADLEGITVNKTGDTITVVEETRQLVTSYLFDGTKIASFPVNVATNPKNALEGIAIDNNGKMFVLNEKDPRLVLEFFNTHEMGRFPVTASSDISDICYDDSADCFWIVSDESKKVFTVDRNGVLLKEWLLTFEKGEGITFAHDRMYIVNDVDGNMYVFQKPR